MKAHFFLLCSLVFCFIALVACAAPAPTATPIPPAPTPVPAKLTLVPPTVAPEVPATKAEDVLGVWLVIFSPSDRFASAETQWEHTADGDRIATFISGTMKGVKSTAKYWFEGGLYKTQYAQSTGEPNSTVLGTYQVYVTKQGGKVIQLRFVVVDDGYVQRVDRITYKPWSRVEP